MGAPRSTAELDELEGVLRSQWLRLRTWVGDLDEVATTAPSVLGDWTVAELVAHLGRAMDALAATRPAPPGTVPLTLAEYLGSYPGRAQDIDRITHELAAQIAADPLTAVDRMTEQAFAQLAVLREAGPDPVVQARRAPVHLSELVLSRVLELVVHGEDLVRSTEGLVVPDLAGGRGPLEPRAVELVAEALLEIVVDRGGWSLEVVDELAWIRVACGRVPVEVATLAAALRPTWTSDSVPDLGRVLPLL